MFSTSGPDCGKWPDCALNRAPALCSELLKIKIYIYMGIYIYIYTIYIYIFGQREPRVLSLTLGLL